MAKILIVEDNKNTAMAAAYSLWNAGHKVDLVETGEAAMKMVEHSIPDLILLDYSLPDTDGLAVLQAIRRDKPEALVVIMTGKGSEQLAVVMLKEGAADYLVKSPGTLETLPHTVERVLEEDRIRRELKEKDEALRQAYNTLEKKVLERTRELTGGQRTTGTGTGRQYRSRPGGQNNFVRLGKDRKHRRTRAGGSHGPDLEQFRVRRFGRDVGQEVCHPFIRGIVAAEFQSGR